MHVIINKSAKAKLTTNMLVYIEIKFHKLETFDHNLFEGQSLRIQFCSIMESEKQQQFFHFPLNKKCYTR
jgi:hypothetical protein